jgi:Leucine-rich repeat (LRR) protein
VRGSAPPRATTDPHRAAAEAVLKAGGTISVMLSQRDRNVSKLADLPAESFVVYRVRFDYPDKPLGDVVKSLVPVQRSLDSFQVLKPTDAKYFTDEDMALLSGMDCMVLKLTDTAVTDVWASQLASNRRVTDAAFTKMGDAFSETIGNWPNLNHLIFSRSRLTTTGFEALHRCPGLTLLSYEDSDSLTGESLAELEKLPKLTSLSLWASPLDAGCLAALTKLKQLRRLRIQHCGVSDEDAVRLQQALPQAFIEHPVLSATSQEKECVEWILRHGGEVAGAAPIKSAESLTSTPTIVTFAKQVPDGAEAAHLTKLRYLLSLYWEGLNEADAALEHLGKLPSLDVLAITNSDLTGAGLRRLSELDGLNQLRLSRNGYLDDAALADLPSLPSLHVLNCDACPLYGPGLAHLSRTPNVQWLYLQDTAISSESLKHLVPLKKLRHLLLESTPIDDSAIKHLSQCTSLQRAQLNGTKVTGAGIERLHKALPNCTIQWDGPLVRPALLTQLGENFGQAPVNGSSEAKRGALGPAPPPAIAPFDAQQSSRTGCRLPFSNIMLLRGPPQRGAGM